MAKKAASPASTERQGGAKSQRTRARVLDAAASVLATEGYAGTRLSAVAEKAQVQAPAIYYYFTSREDLIEEVIYLGIANIAGHVEQAVAALPADADPLERIDVAVAAHLRHELTESDYARAAIRNAEQVPEELRVRYRAEATRYDELWAGLVSAAHDARLLREDVDPEIARFLVLGALNWAPEWWRPRRGSIDTVIAQAQALVRAAICAG